MRLAQFDLTGKIPSVPRPSLTLGLNGTDTCTASLYRLTSPRNVSASTPSSLRASSSRVSAVTRVTCLMWYSSRSSPVTLASKICQANWRGWASTSRP